MEENLLASKRADPELSNYASQLIVILAKYCDKIADTFAKNDFVKKVCDETKESLKDMDFDDTAKLIVSQNVSTLMELSFIEVIVPKVIENGGV